MTPIVEWQITKGSVFPVPCSIKAYKDSGGITPLILNFGEGHVPGRLAPWERTSVPIKQEAE